MRVPSCSSLSSALGESLAGTASQVKRWLLIEDPGPWGYDALAHNNVPQELLDPLREWAVSVSARVVLIRRGARLVGTPRKIFLAASGRDGGWLSALTEDDLDAITSVDRAAFKTGEVPGERIDGLYLVCTHGRHDRCCSVRGNPVARALCARFDEAAWECSHIGGDRFAANIVCLPRGAYFGRVTAAGAEQLMNEYERGTLDLELFRGWSFLPFAVQAAELATRNHFDLSGVGDVVPEDWDKPRSDQVRVAMQVKDRGTMDVSVTVSARDDGFYLTCRAEHPGHPPLFEVTF